MNRQGPDKSSKLHLISHSPVQIVYFGLEGKQKFSQFYCSYTQAPGFYTQK